MFKESKKQRKMWKRRKPAIPVAKKREPADKEDSSILPSDLKAEVIDAKTEEL